MEKKPKASPHVTYTKIQTPGVQAPTVQPHKPAVPTVSPAGGGRVWQGARGTEPRSNANVEPIAPGDRSVVAQRSVSTQIPGQHAATTPAAAATIEIGPGGQIASGPTAGGRPQVAGAGNAGVLRPPLGPAPRHPVSPIGGRGVTPTGAVPTRPRPAAAPRGHRPPAANAGSVAQVHDPYDRMGNQGTVNMTPYRGQAPGTPNAVAQVHAPRGFEPGVPGPQNTGVAQVHNPLNTALGGTYSPGVQEAVIHRFPQGPGGGQTAQIHRPGAPHPTQPQRPGVVSGNPVGMQPGRPVAQAWGQNPYPQPAQGQIAGTEIGQAHMQAATIQPLVQPGVVDGQQMAAAVYQASTLQVQGLTPEQVAEYQRLQQGGGPVQPTVPDQAPPSAYAGTPPLEANEVTPTSQPEDAAPTSEFPQPDPVTTPATGEGDAPQNGAAYPTAPPASPTPAPHAGFAAPVAYPGTPAPFSGSPPPGFPFVAGGSPVRRAPKPGPTAGPVPSQPAPMWGTGMPVEPAAAPEAQA